MLQYENLKVCFDFEIVDMGPRKATTAAVAAAWGSLVEIIGDLVNQFVVMKVVQDCRDIEYWVILLKSIRFQLMKNLWTFYCQQPYFKNSMDLPEVAHQLKLPH